MTKRWLIALVLTVACGRELAVLDPKLSRAFDVRASAGGAVNVDLLLVIDNSGTMAGEQAKLRDQIPRLINYLTNPPADASGRRPAAVERLRVGVVTTDVGTNGFNAGFSASDACGMNGANGANGVLRPAGGGGDDILTWQTGMDRTTFSRAVGEVANTGVRGCGLEQPLLAAQRVLAQHTSGVFSGDDALLAILVLTDEEDCSLADPEEFFSGPEAGDSLNALCGVGQPGLASVETLLTNLIGARDPANIVFSAIVGAPLDGGSDLAQLLSRSEMQHAVGSNAGLRAVCTCNPDPVTDSSCAAGAVEQRFAHPGRRLVEVAQRVQALGGDAVISSICAPSYQRAVEDIAARIGSRLSQICLPGNISRAADGTVLCEVRETLPAGRHCSELAGRTFLQNHADGREICIIAQAGNSGESGWRYESSGATCAEVRFSEDTTPLLGAAARLFCLSQEEVVAAADPSSL